MVSLIPPMTWRRQKASFLRWRLFLVDNGRFIKETTAATPCHSVVLHELISRVVFTHGILAHDVISFFTRQQIYTFPGRGFVLNFVSACYTFVTGRSIETCGSDKLV